jgi:hypothetical protein
MRFLFLLSAYLCVASFCWWADSKNEERRLKYGHITLWSVFGLTILALGLCRFFEIHVLLTVLARTIVGDAYNFHREIQAFILGALATLGCVANVGCLYALRRRLDHIIGFIGIGLLISLFAVRSLSYHHADLVLGLKFSGVSVANLCEIGGLLMVITSNLVRPNTKSCSPQGQPTGWPMAN